jgi:hypothetical protein
VTTALALAALSLGILSTLGARVVDEWQRNRVRPRVDCPQRNPRTGRQCWLEAGHARRECLDERCETWVAERRRWPRVPMLGGGK